MKKSEEYKALVKKIDVFNDKDETWKTLSLNEKDNLVEFLLEDRISTMSEADVSGFYIIERYFNEIKNYNRMIDILNILFPRAEINLNRIQQYFHDDDKRSPITDDYIKVFNIIKGNYKDMLLNGKIDSPGDLAREIGRIAFFFLDNDILFNMAYDQAYSLLTFFKDFIDCYEITESDKIICREIFFNNRYIQIPMTLIDIDLIKNTFEKDNDRFAEIIDVIFEDITLKDEEIDSFLDQEILGCIQDIYINLLSDNEGYLSDDLINKMAIIIGIYSTVLFLEVHQQIIFNRLNDISIEIEAKYKHLDEINKKRYNKMKKGLKKNTIKGFFNKLFIKSKEQELTDMNEKIDNIQQYADGIKDLFEEMDVQRKIDIIQYINNRVH